MGPGAELTERILDAFGEARDLGELEVAGLLLRCCERVIEPRIQSEHDRRMSDEILITAFESLWFQQHEQPHLRSDGEPDDPMAPVGLALP